MTPEILYRYDAASVRTASFPADPVTCLPTSLMGHFFAAGNSGVPGSVEISGLEDLDRRAHAADAVQKFSANEADAAAGIRGWALRRRPRGDADDAISDYRRARRARSARRHGPPLTQLPQQAICKRGGVCSR